MMEKYVGVSVGNMKKEIKYRLARPVGRQRQGFFYEMTDRDFEARSQVSDFERGIEEKLDSDASIELQLQTLGYVANYRAKRIIFLWGLTGVDREEAFAAARVGLWYGLTLLRDSSRIVPNPACLLKRAIKLELSRYVAGFRKRPGLLGEFSEHVSSPCGVVDRVSAAECFSSLICVLSPRQRQLFRLVYQQGLNVTEAAEFLGIDRGAAHSLHRHIKIAANETFGGGWVGEALFASEVDGRTKRRTGRLGQAIGECVRAECEAIAAELGPLRGRQRKVGLL